MRAVLLAVSGDSLSKLLSLFRRFNAYAKDLDLFGNVSFRFVDEGRHLGPAPGSPAAPVKKYDGRRRFFEYRREIYVIAINVLKARRGKFFTDLELGHRDTLRREIVN